MLSLLGIIILFATFISLTLANVPMLSPFLPQIIITIANYYWLLIPFSLTLFVFDLFRNPMLALVVFVILLFVLNVVIPMGGKP